MDRYRIRDHVANLVNLNPEQAVEILARCCEERDKIYQEVLSSLIPPRPQHNEAPLPVGNNINVTFPSRISPSPYGSHHGGTPPPRQGPLRRFPSASYPMSPPGTESSVTSHSTREDSSAGEYVLLPTLVGSKVVDQKARMRSASIEHSVIREDIVGRRNLDDTSNVSRAELDHVEVPHRVTGAFQPVRVSFAIELTWRRPHSGSTHDTLFYVVPKDALDIDMLLGYKDSNEEVAEYTPTIVPQSPARQPPAFQNYKQELRPHAPTPPSASFHRSAMTHDGASSIHRREDQYHPHHLVDPFISRQQSYARDTEGQQPSPAPTVLDTHIEQPQPRRPNPAPPASAPGTDPNKATDKIRLSLTWDATILKVWLDISACSEAFYEAFQKQAARQRKDILDRTTLTIQLMRDENLPFDKAYPLSLDEEDLEVDWEMTRKWLSANRNDIPPHIHGVVEVDGG